MQDPTIQLWCEDEVHFQRHSSLIRMWAPKWQQPLIISPSVRHKVGFFGALNLKTGQLVTQEAPTFSAQTFGDFIRYLLQSTHGKILLIPFIFADLRVSRTRAGQRWPRRLECNALIYAAVIVILMDCGFPSSLTCSLVR